MKRVFYLFLILFSVQTVKSQNMVVSSYYVGSDYRDSWIELLVTEDNLDIRQWLVGDYIPNGGGHLQNYQSIKFKAINLWNHLRRGTIIVIFCRSKNSSNIDYPIDTSKADGFLMVHSQFSAIFDDCPANTDPKLKLDASAEMITIKYASDIHSLGHGTNHSNWNIVTNPKLINDQIGLGGYLIQACPGTSILDYDNTQEDTIKTNLTNLGITLGLPNIRSSSITENQSFWRQMREPSWNSPVLLISTSTYRDSDTLRWNSAIDPFTSDLTQGYLILKSITGTFPAHPTDGVTYSFGDSIGGNEIIGIINNSNTTTHIYHHGSDCNKWYYRIYAFRYSADQQNGNNFHLARGRAYNQSSYAIGNSSQVNPIPILYHY